MIGIDTPETVHPQKPVEYFGKEASKFTRGMVEGKRVRLEYEQGMPQKDRYGRTLAYVYVENGDFTYFRFAFREATDRILSESRGSHSRNRTISDGNGRANGSSH